MLKILTFLSLFSIILNGTFLNIPFIGPGKSYKKDKERKEKTEPSWKDEKGE